MKWYRTSFHPISSVFPPDKHSTIASYSYVTAPSVVDSPDQAAHYHVRGLFKFGASPQIQHLIGYRITKFSNFQMDIQVKANSDIASCKEYLSIHPSIHGSADLFVGPWPLFSFLNFYTVGRTPWTGIIPSQGRYLHTKQHKHRIDIHKHP
jgi:hypothetical protein